MEEIGSAAVNGEQVMLPANVAREGARSLMVMIGGNLVIQAVTLVAALVIPRYLGPQTYGRWSAVMALVSFAAVITQFSLIWVDLLYVGAPWRTGRIEEATKMASTTWLLRLTFSIVVAGIVAAWAFGTTALEINTVLAVTIFGLAAARYGLRTHLSLFMALGLVNQFTALNLARAVLTFLAVLAGFALGGFLGVFLALVTINVALCLTSLQLLRHSLPVRLRLFSWSLIRQHMGYASWTFVGALCRSGQMWLPIYIVANAVSSTEAAFVGVQVQVYAVLTELSHSARNSLLPILAQFDAIGHHSRMRSWGSMIVRYGIAAGCLSIVVWALVGRELIHWILSAAYAPVYEGVILMAVAHTFAFAAFTCVAILNLRGFAKLATGVVACFAFMTLGGVVWVTQSASEGAAVQVAIVFAAAGGVFALAAYFTLGVFGHCWLSLRRSLLLMAPSLLAWPAVAWDTSFGWRAAASLGFTGGYVLLANHFELISFAEMRRLMSRMRGPSEGQESDSALVG